MCLKPDDFFDMIPKHYYAMRDGYNTKERNRAELLRQSVWAAHGSWEGSINYTAWCSKFFPLWFDEAKEQDVLVMTDEQREAILKRHEQYHNHG